MRSECSEHFKNTTEQMFTDIKHSEAVSTSHVKALCVESKTWPVQNLKTNIPPCLTSSWNEWVTGYKAQFKQKQKIIDISFDHGSITLQANLGKDKSFLIEATVPIACVLLQFQNKVQRVNQTAINKNIGLTEEQLQKAIIALTAPDVALLKSVSGSTRKSQTDQGYEINEDFVVRGELKLTTKLVHQIVQHQQQKLE